MAKASEVKPLSLVKIIMPDGNNLLAFLSSIRQLSLILKLCYRWWIPSLRTYLKFLFQFENEEERQGPI